MSIILTNLFYWGLTVIGWYILQRGLYFLLIGFNINRSRLCLLGFLLINLGGVLIFGALGISPGWAMHITTGCLFIYIGHSSIFNGNLSPQLAFVLGTYIILVGGFIWGAGLSTFFGMGF